MASSGGNFEHIAQNAERDVNTHRAKTGHAGGLNDAGVDSSVEKKFPGSQVRYGDDLSSSHRIPPEEGGELDARGRQAAAHLYEGEGGPSDKVAAKYAENPGLNDADVSQGPAARKLESSILGQGDEAARSNAEQRLANSGRQFKGDDYYVPESVPDSISAEGNIPPEGIIQASRETEGYNK